MNGPPKLTHLPPPAANCLPSRQLTVAEGRRYATVEHVTTSTTTFYTFKRMNRFSLSWTMHQIFKKWLTSDTKAKWNSENTKSNFIMMLLSFPLFKCVFNLNSIANNWFIAFICFYMIFIMTQAYERLIRWKKRNEPIAAIVNRKKPFQITIEDLIRFLSFLLSFFIMHWAGAWKMVICKEIDMNIWRKEGHFWRVKSEIFTL